jgi:hypothetical protein
LNEALCIGELVGNPFFGILEPRFPVPFMIQASDLNSTLAMGTSYPATSVVPDLVGALTLANTSSTAGTVSGTQDSSTSTANTANQTVTGTYSSLTPTTGAGLLTLTAPTAFTGEFLVVSQSKIVILSTTAANTEPVLIYLGNCLATCGED